MELANDPKGFLVSDSSTKLKKKKKKKKKNETKKELLPIARLELCNKNNTLVLLLLQANMELASDSKAGFAASDSSTKLWWKNQSRRRRRRRRRSWVCRFVCIVVPVCLVGPGKKSGRQRVRLRARATMAADMYSISWLPAPTW